MLGCHDLVGSKEFDHETLTKDKAYNYLLCSAV